MSESDSSAPAASSAASEASPHSAPKRRRRRRRKRKNADSAPHQEGPSAQPQLSAVATSQNTTEVNASDSATRARHRRSRPKRKSRRDERNQNQKRKRQGRNTQPLTAEERLKRAIALIDSVTREEALELGVLRLSTLHLHLKIGEGERIQETLQDDKLNREVDELRRQITSQVRALVPTQFQRGTVYCFHHDAGIPPPTVDAIFTGYDPLGRPLWTSFLPFCLGAQIPNVEQLYADPPRALGVLMPTPIGNPPIPEVTRGKVYEVLAQLVVGPVSAQFRPLRSNEDRYTLTAQVILARPPEHPLQVRFNLLGLDPDDLFDAAAKSAPRAPISRARNCISSARRAVRRLQEQLTLGKVIQAHLAQESMRILEELRGALLRSISGDQQRTLHAQRRHQSMERPTSEAWRDAARAGDERLFWDHHQETVVVIGPKSRAHIFSEDGRHVTSMRLGVGELERKRGQRRWKLLEPDIAGRFRELVRSRTR